MMDRRRFLLATAAGVAALTCPPLAARSATGRSAALAGLLDRFLQEELALRPEMATQMGLDTGANAGLRGRLSDPSDAGREAAQALTRTQLQRLAAIDPSTLSPADQLDHAVVVYMRQSSARTQPFDYEGFGYGAYPYVVSQLTGTYQSVPNLLDTKQPLATAADADAYLSRLRAFAQVLDAETARMRRDADAGAAPPDFIIDLTHAQLDRTAVPAGQATVVTSLTRRAASAGLDPRYGRDAARIYTADVLPALKRQAVAARTLRARAVPDAGVWRLPRGADFYEAALQTSTTTARSPEEVHRFGLEQAHAISARLDALLRQQGFTKGTVGERMAALYKDPGQLYPDTDAGKRQAIDYCNARLSAIRDKLPAVFNRLPGYAFEVRRVPPETEAGATSAFSQPPAIDGSRPGIVFVNLRDSAEWPKFCLATTIYHEGLPGHQLQGGLALSSRDIPLIRKGGGFSGYAEGWALYAEQLADEIGMYDDDPLGRLGYFKAQLFRAHRCVVDTGLHHYRWSREQAVRYFIEQGGEAPGFAAREVSRYCVVPGQACSYKLGHSVFADLREAARTRMGTRFDIKSFHEAVLAPGRVPLAILAEIGNRWISSTSA